MKTNKHRGSSFDDFLKEEGIFEEVQAKALKRALAEQFDDAMIASKLTKATLATRMSTSRAQVNRILDPLNLSLQLDTMMKAASAMGRMLEIRLKRPPRIRAALA